MSKFRKVSANLLIPGVKLTSAIPDPENARVRLLGEGMEITTDLIQRLQQRGVKSLLLSEKDIAILNAFTPQGRAVKVPPPPAYVKSSTINEQTLILDQQLKAGHDSVVEDVLPFAKRTRKPQNCSYEPGMANQWASETSDSIDSINEIFDETLATHDGSVGPLHATCQDILRRMTEDIDALVCMACSPFETEYPARHGVHLATMSMAIGSQMGLDEALLIELGVGCLVHDIGMKAIGTGMFSSNHPLSAGMLKRLADHPVRGAEVIGRFGEQVSIASKMVAYQIHERCDGSGYPRGRLGDAIHPLAKIACVADAFIGMMSTRPHRLAIQGYHALVQLLEQMKQGKFDATVMRALLELTSLYPLGSFVELSNDKLGRVIRSGGSTFDRPTIEMWDTPNRISPPTVLNLQQDHTIRIVRSIATPKAA
ncbi:metal dependent phosphohydrolase [Rhodopirellula maiorica SM1]|uniref:Metal dependent phosphohydrolase n=1 Tax=Rhodopirellula maiorica SM1 TaxID=1265738 RepID=M5RPD6_9BACT|nr:HD domain-containing phosphohydrolase [Rhodopirellula maiorica]EMI15804.1 metal dependent phosphohydrolase [Rhodopirellula maiorica SM1]